MRAELKINLIRFESRGESGQELCIDRNHVSGEGVYRVASFLVPLATISMNSYDFCTNTVFQS